MKSIAIFSVPRSGSTWLGQIFNSSPEVLYRFQPNFSYSFPYTLKPEDNEAEILLFYKQLSQTEDPFVCGIKGISGEKNIAFAKIDQAFLVWKEVHYLNLIETLLKNSETRVIGLIRNPLAVISSWISIPKEFNPEWDIKEQWKDAPLKNEGKEYNYFGYNRWKKSCFDFLNYSKLYPQKFILCNYQNLLNDPIETVNGLFSFSGIRFTQETKKFLEFSMSSSEDNPYSVIKNKRNDTAWKENLPSFIVDEIMSDPDFISLNRIFNWVK